jgi:hypothetical protein
MGASVSDCDIEDCVVHQEQAYVSAADNGDCGVSGFRNLGGTIRYLHCHAYFNKAHGFEATSAGNLSFLSCISESNRQSGIYINQPKNISIVGGGYYANSFNQTDGSAADSNIYIGNSLQFIITGLTMAKFIGAAPNVPRNIFVDGGSHGLIANCSFADAAADQIVIWNANYINVNNCDFLDALTGTPITGRTPANAVSLNGSSANCKIHDCIIEGSTQILIEMASSWSGNYNEIYNNKVGSGTVTLQDGTTYTSRKWGNRNLTGVKLADRQLGNGGAIGSANDLTLTHGTFFTISNSVQINGIRSAGWDQGSVIILQFLGQPLLKNQGTPSAGFAKLKLSGGADVTPATTNDVFMFVYDGTDFIMCAPFSAIT